MATYTYNGRTFTAKEFLNALRLEIDMDQYEARAVCDLCDWRKTETRDLDAAIALLGEALNIHRAQHEAGMIQVSL